LIVPGTAVLPTVPTHRANARNCCSPPESVHHQGDDLIPTTDVQNNFGRVLENFVELSEAYGNGWPVVAVMGGVGLRGVRLGIGRHHISERIHVNDREIRIELVNGSAEERDGAIKAWLASAQHGGIDFMLRSPLKYATSAL
jgi:hypothetical protein